MTVEPGHEVPPFVVEAVPVAHPERLHRGQVEVDGVRVVQQGGDRLHRLDGHRLDDEGRDLRAGPDGHASRRGKMNEFVETAATAPSASASSRRKVTMSKTPALRPSLRVTSTIPPVTV